MHEKLRIRIKTLESEAKHVRTECIRVAGRKNSKDILIKEYEDKDGNPIARFICSDAVAAANKDIGSEVQSLQHYKKNVLGVEARATFLAYAFLRDKNYIDIENNQPLNYYITQSYSDSSGNNRNRILEMVVGIVSKHTETPHTMGSLEKELDGWLSTHADTAEMVS